MSITRLEPIAQTQNSPADLIAYPGDARYEAARQAWNLSIDQQPAATVMAQSSADIAAAVRYAQQEKLSIAVQATGHGVRRPANGALLINTSQMTDVRVDVHKRTAWVSAGTKWGSVLERAQAVGLAPLLGSSTGVGAVGYTLGGGMGWLARKHGLAADSVRRFEVVTADGEVRWVSREEHSDLFWGLRGGGGSLAIITGMEIELYPVTRVFGGNLVYPTALAGEIYVRYREWVKSLPNAFTTSVAVMHYPPLPELPDFLRGQSVVMVRGCYAGPVAEGEALLQPWLAWQTPIANLFGPMSFAQADTISSDPIEPLPALASGAWLRELSDEAIETLVHYGVGDGRPSPLSMAEVRHAGGAMRNQTSATSPIGHRDAAYVLSLVAVTPTPEVYGQVARYMAEFKAELSPALDGVYMNFLDGDETRERTKDAYALENYERLMRLKTKYDPQERLCHSFNIPAAR